MEYLEMIEAVTAVALRIAARGDETEKQDCLALIDSTKQTLTEAIEGLDAARRTILGDGGKA